MTIPVYVRIKKKDIASKVLPGDFILKEQVYKLGITQCDLDTLQDLKRLRKIERGGKSFDELEPEIINDPNLYIPLVNQRKRIKQINVFAFNYQSLLALGLAGLEPATTSL